MASYTPHEQFADVSDDYLDQHDIYGLFGHMFKQLAIHKPKDPYSFMISLLDQPTNVLKIIVIGSPGSGKDTQVSKIVANYGVVAVRVDNLIREELQNKTAVGAKIKSFQDKKEPIPEDIITTIIGSRISKQDCVKQGWLLDGYPTTRLQAQSLQMAQAGIMCNKFLVLRCSERAARERFKASEKFQELEITDAQLDDMYSSYARNLKQFTDLFQDVRGYVDTEQDKEQAWQDTKTFLERTPVTKAPRRPMRVLMLGPTGAGKATQCKKLNQKYGLVHVSVGDLLRKESVRSEALAEKLAPYMAAGALVPDEIVSPIVCKRLLQSDCRDRGWLLDGFPRTTVQAQALGKHHLVPNRCVLLEVPEAVALERLLSRRLDPATGDYYFVTDENPAPAGMAARLITEDKCKENNARTLLMEYAHSIDELAGMYGKIVRKFSGTQDERSLFLAIEAFLRSSIGAKPIQPVED